MGINTGSPRMFHGWIVVAAAFVITFVAFGSAYTFSAFLQSLQREFGASRGSVSLVFSLSGFIYFSLGTVSGRLADRWGARRLAVSGMALVGLGLMLASVARSLSEVYIAYCMGVGFGVGFAYVPVLGAVQRWFTKRRGLASGLAVSGIGLGTLAMPMLASLLIAAFDWRRAYLILGASAVVLGVSMAFLIEDNPRDRGLHPDGEPPSRAEPGAREGASIKQAVGSSTFRSLYAACLLSSIGVFVPFVHLIPMAQDLGVEQTAAALLIAIIGAGSTLGRFFLGAIADRIGRQQFLVAMYIGMGAAMTIWMAASGFASLACFALIFGVFYGGWVAILPTVVMDRFGGANVSGIIGILYTSVAIGTLIGPSAAGFLFDVSRSYTWPIVVSIAANIVAAGITGRSLREAWV
jgi:OFA family oxalate/formate antiporter-like MFS transporter